MIALIIDGRVAAQCICSTAVGICARAGRGAASKDVARYRESAHLAACLAAC
jgi:hypothetical protein